MGAGHYGKAPNCARCPAGRSHPRPAPSLQQTPAKRHARRVLEEAGMKRHGCCVCESVTEGVGAATARGASRRGRAPPGPPPLLAPPLSSTASASLASS
eukprot:357145-Rhodomonas_salina.1